MFLKNTKARLITINGSLDGKGQRTEKFQVKPGNNPAVEVPDKLCKTAFVQALLADGALVEVQGNPTKPDLPKPKEQESVYDELDKAQLVALCEESGLEVTSRDTKSTLVAKLEAE